MNGSWTKVTTMGEPFDAFVPDNLPESLPGLEENQDTKKLLKHAENSLAMLDVANDLVLSQEWLLYGFVRKEAVVSSQIEGTQATLTDLLEADEDMPENPDLEEVCNYLAAIKFAWNQMEDEKGLPLSLRLLKETHKHLMKGVRGSNKTPGEFRKSQNWIGGATPQEAIFVPPPADKMIANLDNLERYFHIENKIHPLIRIGMVHVQFETIHPFLDGNGRLGRLLIALMLKEYGLLSSPLLYLSLYFKKEKKKYYELLNQVRFRSDWTEWNNFFLRGVDLVSKNVVETSKNLHQIVNEDRDKLLSNPKANVNALRLQHLLPKKPIVSQAKVVEMLELTKPTANKAISLLVDEGVLVEVTGKKRDRVFHFKRYLDSLAKGTEL